MICGGYFKMIHRKSRYFTMLVFAFILLNLYFPSPTSNLLQNVEIDQTLDDISFDEICRMNQDRTQYQSRFKNESTINNYSMTLTDINDIETRYENMYNSNDAENPIGSNLYDDALMDSCWPMKSQNRGHTCLSPYNTIGNNGIIKWDFETDDWTEGGIAIDTDNVLYFGDFDRYLYAMFPDGTLKWKYKTDGWIWSTPALTSDGTIYIGTLENSFYAINPNGTLKWKYDAKASITSSSPAISKDGLIYFGTLGNPEKDGCKIICLNSNGSKNWEYQTGYKITSSPAIADDGTIYIGSGDSYLYALNPNGSLRWRFNTGDIVKSHPAIGDDGTIYFDSFDDYLYALNSDGSLKWKYTGVGSGAAGPAIDENGIIYIGGSRLSAFYPDGTIKWQYTFGDDKHTGHSSPAISADGTIYIGATKGEMSGGFIYAINSEDGSLKWQQKISNDWVGSSPSIDVDGTVYIGSSDHYTIDGEPYGILYAFGRNEENQAPESPVITGTNRGRVKTSYSFNFTVHDPELDTIELLVDWGDGTDSGWIGPFDSDEDISLSHIWSEKGTFELRAKARDTFDGSESDWSTLSVTMPKTRPQVFFFHLWEQLLQHLPNISLLFNE